MFGSASDLTAQEKIAWYNVMGQFEAKSREFEAARAQLEADRAFVATQSPQVQAEYRVMLDRAARVGNTVRNIRAALDDVQNALRGAWDAVTGIWDRFTGSLGFDGIGGLGAVPLIPIAAVAAAIAVVSYFLTDYAKFAGRLSQLRALQSQGIAPDRAVELVEAGLGPPSSPLFPSVGGLTTVALIVGAVVLLWPTIRKGMN